jgi:hypothetical protein
MHQYPLCSSFFYGLRHDCVYKEKDSHFSGYILCRLDQDDGAILATIAEDTSKRLLVTLSVVTEAQTVPSSDTLRIRFFPTAPSVHGPATFALCTQPLLYGRRGFQNDNPDFLIQYIEYYKAMGASHLILYNYTFSQKSLCFLDYYVQQVTESDEYPILYARMSTIALSIPL